MGRVQVFREMVGPDKWRREENGTKKERGEEGIERRDRDFKWHKNWAEYQVLFVDAAVLSSSLKTLWDAKHGKGGLEFTRAVGVVSNQHPSSKASCAWLCNFRWLPLPSTPTTTTSYPTPKPSFHPFLCNWNDGYCLQEHDVTNDHVFRQFSVAGHNEPLQDLDTSFSL